jgi:hypothetical protein
MSPPVQLSIRESEGVRSYAVSDVVGAHFDAAVPWRRFRPYRNQRHYTGAYWASTMRAHVGFESRLELANLLLLDFDPAVEGILSQPFLMEGVDDGVRRRHVPDFLLRMVGGPLCLVDVKPADRLDKPKVRASLGWTRTVMDAEGWEYRICSEPDPVLAANVRFLAGYRRPTQFALGDLAAARSALSGEQCFDDAVDAIQAHVADRARARGLALHLLWTRWLRADLSRLLQGSTVVVAA